jgi:hypothetical protein
MPHFLTSALDEERFDEALPLVRMAIPGLDRERWHAHCRQMARQGGGVLAAAADGALHGIASWHPDEDLRLGKVLRVEMIVALELSSANPVRAALCETLETLCAAHDAVGIALSVPVRDRGGAASSFPESWRRAGFRRQALFICKPVRPGRRWPAPPAGGSHLRLVEAPDPPE